LISSEEVNRMSASRIWRDIGCEVIKLSAYISTGSDVEHLKNRAVLQRDTTWQARANL